MEHCREVTHQTEPTPPAEPFIVRLFKSIFRIR
jgi:hypothetical protein